MKYLQHIILTAMVFILSSCGEDRSGEFYALIENRMWIEEVMLENYLWYKDIQPVEDEDDYFQEPTAFFKKMLSKEAMNGKGDKYSYMEVIKSAEDEEARAIALKRNSTYGIDFELTSDPTGTTAHTYARVLYLLPNSPAEKAGLKRGDWISAINGNRITNDNYHLMQEGGEVSLARNRIIQQEEGYGWQAIDTLKIGPSTQMEINPFFIDSLYQVNGQKIAYLMYNDFSSGPQNDPTETAYNEQMKRIFTQFKAQAPDAFILDLRYNPGGYVSCAQVLGSMLAPASAMGKTFINLEKNDKANPQTSTYPFDSQYADANLNLNKIYILTSSYTASASEAIINGLIPYLGEENVVLLGEKTEGKNVAMTSFENDTFGLILWPVIALVSNAEGFSDYSEGFQPKYALKERNIISPWYPLGDVNEYLLKNALSLITTGVVPDAPAEDTETAEVKYSTVSARGIQGMRIR